MKGTKTLTFTLTLLLISSWLIAQENLTGREIADRAIESTKLVGVEAVATMTIIDGKGRERIRKVAQVTKLYDNGNTEKRLIHFMEPADVKGTGLLSFDYKSKDDDMWLYMPALRKTRRIISSEKSKSFMGSEFSYADTTPPSMSDFNHTILGEEEINGVLCWKIEMVPVNDDIADKNGFSKRISFIGKEDFVIRKGIYYDLDGELHKELTVKKIKEMDPENHKYIITHMIMENRQNNRKSILEVDQAQFNPDVKDEFFTTRYLERG
jgi:hypothetical protein